MPRHYIKFHDHRYEVSPGFLRVLARASDPSDTLLLYGLLLTEGYGEDELNLVAQAELFPPAEQLPLFDLATGAQGNPWQRQD